MTQKTISISERVYKLLKNEKREGESFSNVIERMLSKKNNPWLTMQKKFDPELWEGLKEKLINMREKNLTGVENNE
jgi:predicted CopG family antitoxin